MSATCGRTSGKSARPWIAPWNCWPRNSRKTKPRLLRGSDKDTETREAHYAPRRSHADTAPERWRGSFDVHWRIRAPGSDRGSKKDNAETRRLRGEQRCIQALQLRTTAENSALDEEL